MVWLQVDTHRLAGGPLERYTPRPVHVQAVARQLESAQRMEIESWHVELRQLGRRVQRIEPAQSAVAEVGPHLGGVSRPNSSASPLCRKLRIMLCQPMMDSM